MEFSAQVIGLWQEFWAMNHRFLRECFDYGEILHQFRECGQQIRGSSYFSPGYIFGGMLRLYKDSSLVHKMSLTRGYQPVNIVRSVYQRQDTFIEKQCSLFFISHSYAQFEFGHVHILTTFQLGIMNLNSIIIGAFLSLYFSLYFNCVGVSIAIGGYMP